MDLSNKIPPEQLFERANKEQLAVWKSECNITGQMVEMTFDNFESKYQPVAFNKIKYWCIGKSYVLSSENKFGLGKTHLVAALVNQILSNSKCVIPAGESLFYKVKCPVYFTTETALAARIRATFDNENKKETEESVYMKISRYSLLIIDDVGKVRPRDLSFLQGIYFRIIDDRYNLKQDIIITTNLGGADLENHIGGACADRLIEMCGPDGIIKMSGESYRRK